MDAPNCATLTLIAEEVRFGRLARFRRKPELGRTKRHTRCWGGSELVGCLASGSRARCGCAPQDRAGGDLGRTQPELHSS